MCSLNFCRTVFLRLASITVLVVTIGTQLMCDSPPCIAGVLVSVTEFLLSYLTIGIQLDIDPWKNFLFNFFSVGRRTSANRYTYKLALLDFVVVNLVILFVDFPRRLIY